MDAFSSQILEHQIKLWCNKEIVLQKIKEVVLFVSSFIFE